MKAHAEHQLRTLLKPTGQIFRALINQRRPQGRHQQLRINTPV